MKLRKHKDKTFALRLKFAWDRRYFTTYRKGNDADSVIKGFLFGRDKSQVEVVSAREYHA